MSPRRAAALAVATALVVATASARAQPAQRPPAVRAPDAGSCAPEQRALAPAEASRRACEAARASCDERVDRAERAASEAAADLAAVRRERDEAGETAATCQAARVQTCSAVGGVVASVLALRSELPRADAACVSPANAHALSAVVASWRNSRTALQRLEAFARGEADALPAPVGGALAGEMDTLAQRLAGGGREPPLVYRRLLIEAVAGLAPHFWQRLRAAGQLNADAWFSSSEELDAAFVDEAQATLATRPGSGGAREGAAQTAALHLVRSYQTVCDCAARAELRGCARAAQLVAYLESSAALLARQRVAEVWQTPCRALAPATVLEWLREFPAPQHAPGRAEWDDVLRATYDKLVACYLADASAGQAHFPDWLTRTLPAPAALTRRSLAHLDALRSFWDPVDAEALCLEASHALRTLPAPVECALPEPARAALRAWFERRRATAGVEETLALGACAAYVDALWRGRRVDVLEESPSAPSAEELVRGAAGGPAREGSGGLRAALALRAQCGERRGALASFPRNLARVAAVAGAAGEDTVVAPWRLDPASNAPAEAAHLDSALRVATWLRHRVSGTSACAALGFTPARCGACAAVPPGTRYDCALLTQVEERWRLWQRVAVRGLIALVLAVLLARWAVALRRALRTAGGWRRELVGHLRGLGLAVRPDVLRFVLPARMATIRLGLPDDGAWERWGRTMVVARAESAQLITERDVRAAALAARRHEGELAIVTHEDGAAPNLPAVRAMLDWAAQSPNRAVQVLPVSTERLRWARNTDDLLDLVEQISLRGNPFEVRGRLVSSSQFFNRERLVSGLLAAAHAGSWTVVTGLRRFGKSSLALEVARRLNAPYAYVDLAGFHHEIASGGGGDASRAASAILRYMCRQLHASARTLYGARAALPEPPDEGGGAFELDSLAGWIREFLAACRAANQGRQLAPLVIFDEVEQAIGVGAERVTTAIDSLSVLVGRLRACLSDTLATQGGDRVGVLFCSAIHAALWAPLTTLGRQSLIGAFPSVCVPRLPEDAAFAMMRGLGARQGIRFTDQALGLIVREAQGIPILVRRIGSSILELYDPERARQGSLGAVEVGIEGATAAVRREEEDGAPLRVWVESEIGDPRSPVGGLLRELARRGTASVELIKEKAFHATMAQFEELGLARLLGPDEARRRALEAAGFMTRMLDEIGILVPEGDATRPHAFTFPDSIIRRILAAERADTLLGF